MILICENKEEFNELIKELNFKSESEMYDVFGNIDYNTEHMFDIVIYMMNCRNMKSSDYVHELDDISTYPAEVNRNLKKFIDLILT